MQAYRQFLFFTFMTRLSFAFSFATYVMFLLSRDASLLEVGLINISFMVAIAIAEIPTGIFADLFGRKPSFLISNLIMASGLLVYFLSHSFWWFVIAEVTAGIGMTFRSGALEAWAVDSVLQSSDPISIQRIFSSGEIVKNAAGILGGLAGAYMGTVNLAYPWLAGAILLFITFLIAGRTMHEPARLNPGRERSPFLAIKRIVERSVTHGLKKRVVLLLMTTTLLSSFFYQPLNMYWQPRFADIAGGKIWVLGWIWVFISVSLMAGNYLAKRVSESYPPHRALAVSALFNSLPIIAAAFLVQFLPVLVLFCLYEVARGITEPVRMAFINEEIPSAERATLLSLDQVFMRVGAIAGLYLTGLVADRISIPAAWIIGAVVGLATLPIFVAAGRGRNAA